ncbi:Zygote defective protein 12 [Bienertia sinuspersici]
MKILLPNEPIQPLHHQFLHMNEDTQHLEQSPSSIHALSESRLQHDLEDSSSESEDFNQGGGRDVCATKVISSRPRRRTVIPDWPEHVKFDEKEEAIAFGKHGFISEQFFSYVIIGFRLFIKHFLLKKKLLMKDAFFAQMLMENVTFWHKLKKKMKADIVILVRMVSPQQNVERYNPVKKQNYLNLEKMLEHNLDMLTSVVLKALLIEELNFKLDFYKSVYTKKDGSFKEGTLSQQFLEDANNKVKECLASSSSKSRVDIENEVFDDLMYNGEVPKRPLNYVFGVKQSDIFGVQGLLRKKGSSYVNHSAIEMENLKAEFSAVKKQNEDLRQKNQALESKFDDTVQSFKEIASHLAQVLKEVRNGNASAHLLDGADSAVKLIDTQVRIIISLRAYMISLRAYMIFVT